MAKKAEQNNKNLIIGICMALILIAIVVVVVVLVIKNNNPTLSDSYFTSDDTKLVLNLEPDQFSAEEESFQPVESHLIYYYSGDTITDMKSYYEYANEADAKSAYEYYKANLQSEFQNIELDGKFLILTANPSDYEGITAYDVEEQIKFIESINNNQSDEEVVDIKEPATEETVEETTVEETVVEEVTE